MTLHISAGQDIACAFSFLFCEFNSALNAERSQTMKKESPAYTVTSVKELIIPPAQKLRALNSAAKSCSYRQDLDGQSIE